jgi:hypothetical protein
MPALQSLKLRGRCACGLAVRLRNAQPSTLVPCPRCGAVFHITREHFRAAAAGEDEINVELTSQPLLEARLLDGGELRLAREGAKIGATGKLVHISQDAAILSALGGRMPASRGASTLPTGAEFSGPQRPFGADLLASFYFCGRPWNAFHLGIATLACWLPLAASLLPGLAIPALGLNLLMAAYFTNLTWTIMTETARGEDDVPLGPQSWDWWEDVSKPILLNLWVTGICAVPALIAWYYADKFATAAQDQAVLIVAAAVFGSFFWPILLLAAATDEPFLIARPDLLFRGLWNVGPLYLFVWLLSMIALGGPALAGWSLDHLQMRLTATPAALVVVPLMTLLSVALEVYFGYVLYRTIGLISRHRGDTLPW